MNLKGRISSNWKKKKKRTKKKRKNKLHHSECLKSAYIDRPRELYVIQKLKPFYVIFSHTTIIIGRNKVSCTTAKVSVSNNVPNWDK